MATNEELETRIAELEDMIKSEYDPPSGPEYSFPVPGQPIDQDQFQLLSLASGSGVIDRGGQPYWLKKHATDAITNQKNSMNLTTSVTTGNAEAVVGGYYHVLNQDKEIPLPAVSVTTTYWICLTFDPRYITETGDLANQSVSVQVYTTNPPTTFGRIHVVLWKVIRKSNQLLSDAEVIRVRPKVVPTITVNDQKDLPDPATVLWGSVAICTNDNQILRAVGSSNETGGPTSWTSVTDPSWSEWPDTPTYKWVGHGHRRSMQRKGKTRRLRGRIAPVDGVPFSSGSSDGYLVFSLPDGDKPAAEHRFITAGPRSTGAGAVSVTVFQSGEVRAWPIGDVKYGWIGLDGIEFDVE